MILPAVHRIVFYTFIKPSCATTVLTSCKSASPHVLTDYDFWLLMETNSILILVTNLQQLALEYCDVAVNVSRIDLELSCWAVSVTSKILKDTFGFFKALFSHILVSK